MKKSKIFLAASALILSVAGVFAARAAKRFTAFTTAYVGKSSNIFIHVPQSGLQDFFTTDGVHGKSISMRLYTVGGVNLLNNSLYTAGGTQLYYNPNY